MKRPDGRYPGNRRITPARRVGLRAMRLAVAILALLVLAPPPPRPRT